MPYEQPTPHSRWLLLYDVSLTMVHAMSLNWTALLNFINMYLFFVLFSLQSVCTLDICHPERLWLGKSTELAALTVEGSAANPYQPSGGMQTMMVQTQSPVLPQQQSQDQGNFFFLFSLFFF